MNNIFHCKVALIILIILPIEYCSIQCEVWGNTLKCSNRAFGNLKDLHNDEITELDFADCNLRFLDPTWLKQFPKLSIIQLNGNQIDCSCLGRRKIYAFVQQGVRLFGYCAYPKELVGYTLNNLSTCEDQRYKRHVKGINTNRDFEIITVQNGEHITLNCTVPASSCEEYLWMQNGHPIVHDGRVQQHAKQLLIGSVKFTDSGHYKCVDAKATNKTYDEFQLSIFGKPEVYFDNKVYFPYTGVDFEINCNARGFPIPQISWQKNDKPINNPRIVFTENNSKLIIRSLHDQNDNGQYKCIAKNRHGTTSAICEVQSMHVVPPSLTNKPNRNLISYVSGSVTVCCLYSGSPHPHIKWYFGTKKITFYERYSMNADKCLVITNITMADVGEYECVISNIGGTIKHRTHIDVLNPSKLVPNDLLKTLRMKAIIEDNQVTLNTAKYIIKQQLPVMSVNEIKEWLKYGADEIRDLRIAEKVFHFIMSVIREHLERLKDINHFPITQPEDVRPDCNTDKNKTGGLSALHIHRIAEMTGCFPHQIIPDNCYSKCLIYRTADGTCNNLANKMWGASQTPFARWLKAEYQNGLNLPKGWNETRLYNGYKLPSPRLVSSNIIAANRINPDPMFTHMLMQWGQFLDHDITHTLMATGTHEFSDARLCTSSCTKEAPCFPIKIPDNDNRTRHRGNCIEFVRSTDVCLTGETSFLGVKPIERQQINQITSYIDASNVYGSTEQELHDLREHSFGKGLLRMRSDVRFRKRILPFAVDTPVDCQRDRDVRASPVGCFLTGDHRASEQLGLTATHTIWARQHNRLATKLSNMNPKWSSEQVFQEARKILAAQLQHITYKDWLRHILGEELPPYRNYNSLVNSQAANVIATSAFRFGHSIINPIIYRLNESMQPISEGNLLLRQAFFSPWRLLEEGGIDPLLRGMYAVPAKIKQHGQIVNSELTEQLFHLIREISQDLGALNIQRGRDHGLPSYTQWRQFCNLPVPSDFSDLPSCCSITDLNAVRKLRKIYGDVRNIDVWAGGILEDNVDNGKVGELFRCLLKRQFVALRDGDRFWYENAQQFSKAQLKEIKKTTLSKIICENADSINSIPLNVFYRSIYPHDYVSCSSIPDVNLMPWKNCCQQNVKGSNEVCNQPSIHNYDPIPNPKSYF